MSLIVIKKMFGEAEEHGDVATSYNKLRVYRAIGQYNEATNTTK